MHKNYRFFSCLKMFLNKDQPGSGFDIKDLIVAKDFIQKKNETHTRGAKISNPELKLSIADRLNISKDDEKKLSEIISEINNRTGKSFDENVAAGAILQIRDLMKNNKELKRCANNTIDDFKMEYYEQINDTLVKGMSQNHEFFTMLLNNEDIKKDLLGMFVNDVYESYHARRIQ